MTVQETIGSYFGWDSKCRPAYAVVRIKGSPLGEIKTWSCSKRKACEERAAQWDPTEWRLVKMSVAE